MVSRFQNFKKIAKKLEDPGSIGQNFDFLAIQTNVLFVTEIFST